MGLRQIQQQPCQNIRGDVIGQVGRHPHGCALAEPVANKGRQIGFHHVRAKDLNVLIRLKRDAQNRDQAPVNFNGQNLPGPARQRPGQRPKSRADFQHAVLFSHERSVGQLLKQRFILDKILSQAVFRMKRSMFSGFQVRSSHVCVSCRFRLQRGDREEKRENRPLFPCKKPLLRQNASSNPSGGIVVGFGDDVMRPLFNLQIGFGQILPHDSHA